MGRGHPPPKPPNPPKAPKKPKKPRHFEGSEEEAHPLAPHPKPKAKPKAKPKGKAKPSPKTPGPHLCEIGAGIPMEMCRVWETPGMLLGRRGAMWRVSQLTV